MSKTENKIDADDRTVLEVLDNKKYTVDYFQREYSWQQKHIEQLVTDLTSAFLAEYSPADSRSAVENYNSYYLGPFVLSEKNGRRSIIDGQQRLTSLTLFLIYLNNLQRGLGLSEKIESMIFSEKFGEKSFNIDVPERIPCLKSLFENGAYLVKDSDDESTKNMAERYGNIDNAFPKEIDKDCLPNFLDWMRERVILVEIVAYSDDNAYTIFETMNDRGMNLTSTEMLKGFILSRFKNFSERENANKLWKSSIQALHLLDKDEDQRFFQAWLRAQYAETIRPGTAGSKNEDFEKIGTRFHSWFRDNLGLVKLSPENSEDFSKFMSSEFCFFRDAYLKIKNAETKFESPLEHVFYIKRWGIADSLSYPLMLAPLNVNDSPETVQKKINLVAKYIETFVVRRSVNFKKFSASSIRYTMYSIVKEIRNKSLSDLHAILSQKVSGIEQTWEGLSSFRMHGQNARFVKYLLARMTSFIEMHSGKNSNFETYFENPQGKAFEIEHIWADKFDEHTDEFDQKTDFDEYRNRFGDLLLLPNGSNQSYGGKPYVDKMPHYIKENLLAQTLCAMTYQNNPNFLNMKNKFQFDFEPLIQFKKSDLIKRQNLYRKICEAIWAFESEANTTDMS
jgi:uncharacterized protein with ParB-like and HNH nuclease domain